jgi:hypothetical protein
VTSYTAFDGLVWTWARTFVQGTTAPLILDPVTGSQYDQIARQSVARARLDEDITRVHSVNPCPLPPHPPLPGMRLGDIFPYANQPGLQNGILLVGGGGVPSQIATANFAPIPASTLIDPSIVGALEADPNTTLVMGLDPVDRSNNPVRGALIGISNRTLLGFVTVSASGQMVRESISPKGLAADPPSPPVISVSNRRGEVAFFDDRDVNGQLMPRIRVFDMNFKVWREKPSISRAKLEAPIAVAYHTHDDAYYVLDKATVHGATKLRLVRMARGFTVEVIAEWPHSGRFDDYAITAAVDGALLITAS